MADLSVLIPARQEKWLSRTVEDILEHSQADTEVIVVCDGAWPEAGFELKTHSRVTVLYHKQPIGQRAATNLAARVSTAPWIMKLDGHCSVADGFDVELIQAGNQLGPSVVQIPAQKNLHIYSWKCQGCGYEKYQGPDLASCPSCKVSGVMVRVMMWRPRPGTTTTAWRLDDTLHFQYYKAGQKTQTGDICDVMTSLGACFFMSREWFRYIDGLDEGHGSWGNFGAEVALKTWLGGGRHVVNRRTFFCHFFRVGGIGFPYPIRGSEQEFARQYSRDLWFGNNWPKQTRPLSWLIEKFAPLPGWHQAPGASRLAAVMAAGTAFTSRQESGVSLLGDPSQIGRVQADLTVPPATAGHGVQHQLGQGMAVDAVRLSSGQGARMVPAEQVVLGNDLSQMGGVATDLVVAPVIDQRLVSADGGSERTIDPCGENSVHSSLGTAGVASWESDPRVSSLGTDIAGPIPATSVSVDNDLRENTGQLLAVKVGDRESIDSSHASASIADVGSGSAARLQRASDPSILPSKGLCYYTDSRADPVILRSVQEQVCRVTNGMPVAAVTCDNNTIQSGFGLYAKKDVRYVRLHEPRGILTMFKQILAGIEALDSDYVFLIEQDVLYASDHFQFTPPRDDTYYYNEHVWHVDARSGRAVTYTAKRTSQLCASRMLLVEHYRRRVERVERSGFTRAMGFEPGSHRRPERIDDVPSASWRSMRPNIDIKHGKNLTPARWSQSEFRSQRNCQDWQESDRIPGWGVTLGRFSEFLQEVGRV